MFDIYDNQKFKYVNKNRLVELDYDHSQYKSDFLDYFQKNIRNEKYSGWGQTTDKNGIKQGATKYHIDYGPWGHMQDWIWLCHKFEALMKDAGCYLDFNEFKHTLKFTFIEMEEQSNLFIHTDTYIREGAAVIIPLAGITEIDLYEDDEKNPHIPGKRIDTRNYTSPCLLNPNEFHGVRNFVDGVDGYRLMLKVHLLVINYPMLIESFSNPVKVLRFDPPWDYKRGTPQKI